MLPSRYELVTLKYHVMKIKLNFITGALCLATVLCMMHSCTETSAEEAKAEEPVEISMEEKIARGAYLVTVMDCETCHSPKVFTAMGPVPDSTRRLAGHWAEDPFRPVDAALVSPGNFVMTSQSLTDWYGPWGVSYAANLTPDDTGIGMFELEHFVRAFRHGKYRGVENGRTLLPPMPWQNFGQMPDEDIEAIFLYLKSLPPIKNLVPQAQTYEQLAAASTTQ